MQGTAEGASWSATVPVGLSSMAVMVVSGAKSVERDADAFS